MFKALLALCFLALVPGLALATGGGSAGVDLSGISLDTASPLQLAAMVSGGLAVMWGIRKVIKLWNRS